MIAKENNPEDFNCPYCGIDEPTISGENWEMVDLEEGGLTGFYRKKPCRSCGKKICLCFEESNGEIGYVFKKEEEMA